MGSIIAVEMKKSTYETHMIDDYINGSCGFLYTFKIKIIK